MTGARKKIDENGLEVAGLRSRRIWVSDQRNPDDAEADMTRMNPRASKAVSPATIMIMPTVIVVIMAASFQEGFSRRKRKAKRRTKPRTEDLHIAIVVVSFGAWEGGKAKIRTVKGEGNELQAHIAEANVKSCSRSARPDAS
jgi:hypothetical protein